MGPCPRHREGCPQMRQRHRADRTDGADAIADRTPALLIRERTERLVVRHFRHPLDRHAEKGSNPIGHDGADPAPGGSAAGAYGLCLRHISGLHDDCR